MKPIHFINIAIKPHNVRGDEIIKMLEELGGTNAFSFDGSDHNCVNPFAYYIDNDDKQIYGGGIEFLRKNGYKIHTLEELKKKEYPKTYEECCKVMGINHTNDLDICEHCDYKTEITYYEDSLLEKIEALYRLRICRDAYWKMYGEEMGLGKPWEPEDLRYVYSFFRWDGDINMSNIHYGNNNIFEFPTEEMRDAFYDNFKEEIEICKELL